jgi:integrase/recombinase XerD
VSDEVVFEAAIISEQNAVFCSRLLFPVNRFHSHYFSARILVPFMSGSLFDAKGNRKYLTARERLAFVHAASKESAAISTFCLTMAFTGARISEVLALTATRIDAADEAIIFETLKQRKKRVFRAVPVPRTLIPLLTAYGVGKPDRLWPWGRNNAWKVVKAVMREAGIAECLCKPKALRHAFAVEAGQKAIPLNIVQRWLGHARIETTAIYASAIGDEERNLARRAWSSLELAIPEF